MANEPESMILPLLREMRGEIREQFGQVHERLENVEKRLDKLESGQKTIR
ncbi:hypothetical protein LRX75_15015 [Rhizobium sp. DKSPLA3]|uniref:Uncharacterized protein n=1 Tax=Rhizobium quercicola TaxID=2901226 RepID=A0A9X1T1Y7_9HYPH|nr:hypothetical protein [Rhizobium quercicola]MCD7110350.1 hypothetical protein [Rhizobium quercicola]